MTYIVDVYVAGAEPEQIRKYRTLREARRAAREYYEFPQRSYLIATRGHGIAIETWTWRNRDSDYATIYRSE